MIDCPVKYALDILNGKWKLRIIWELNQQETIRFSKQYNEIPPKVEYSITSLGKGISSALQALGDWGSQVYALNKNIENT